MLHTGERRGDAKDNGGYWMANERDVARLLSQADISVGAVKRASREPSLLKRLRDPYGMDPRPVFTAEIRLPDGTAVAYEVPPVEDRGNTPTARDIILGALGAAGGFEFDLQAGRAVPHDPFDNGDRFGKAFQDNFGMTVLEFLKGADIGPGPAGPRTR